MVTTADEHEERAETFDVFTRGRVFTVVGMFALMLAVSSHRQDVVSSIGSRVGQLHATTPDTGWVPVKPIVRTAVHADSVEPTGHNTYRVLLRFRVAATYHVYTHDEVDCDRRLTRTIYTRRLGIRNDSTRSPNTKWSEGGEVTQRKLAFLCELIARRQAVAMR
jgi:hypothetical protein